MNTISYNDLKKQYINNDTAKITAKDVFGEKQPSIFQTGFYSSPSWNWGYQIGTVCVQDTETHVNTFYEVVTRFGTVEAARQIYIPMMAR